MMPIIHTHLRNYVPLQKASTVKMHLFYLSFQTLMLHFTDEFGDLILKLNVFGMNHFGDRPKRFFELALIFKRLGCHSMLHEAPQNFRMQAFCHAIDGAAEPRCSLE